MSAGGHSGRKGQEIERYGLSRKPLFIAKTVVPHGKKTCPRRRRSCDSTQELDGEVTSCRSRCCGSAGVVWSKHAVIHHVARSRWKAHLEVTRVPMNDSSKVRDFVVKNFLFGDGESLKDDTSFIEEGIIDSTGILELIMFLEETYRIEIKDSELVPDNMDSLQNIARFVQKKTGGSAAAEA
mgnify:FL=1